MADGLYADIDLGIMIIRGENIVLFGEVDSLDMEPALQQVQGRVWALFSVAYLRHRLGKC